MSILVYRGTNKRVVAKLSRRLFDADWNLAAATRENIAGASLVLTATDGTNTIEVGGSVVDADDGIAEFLLTPGHTMALPNSELRLPYQIKYWTSAGAQEVVVEGTLIIRTGETSDPYDPPAPLGVERIHESTNFRSGFGPSTPVPATVTLWAQSYANERHWPSARRAIYRSLQWSCIPNDLTGAGWTAGGATALLQSAPSLAVESLAPEDWETIHTTPIAWRELRGDVDLGGIEVAAGHCVRVVFEFPADFARTQNFVLSANLNRVTLEA